MLPRFNFQNQVNAIGGLAFVMLAGYIGWDMSRSREATPCSTRVPVATLMSLQRPDGQPLTPGELQARAGFGERGVIDKTAIRRADGTRPFVLDVALGGPQQQDTGAGFFWAPAGVGKAATACLAYQVLVPADFDYGAGGTLPGFYGELNSSAHGNGQTGLSTRVAWDREGDIKLQVNLSEVMGPMASSEPITLASSTQFPRGRWVNIEQELVFNSPNSKDGVLRMWIDGRLRIDETTVAWRGTNSVHLMGSLVDVSYLPRKGDADVKASRLTLSPLRLAWQ